MFNQKLTEYFKSKANMSIEIKHIQVNNEMKILMGKLMFTVAQNYSLTIKYHNAVNQWTLKTKSNSS